nr:hypothetical protein [Bradyrhizobium sp. WSM3983]
MVRQSIAEAGDATAQSAREDPQKSLQPMQRFGFSSEVVGAVLYLLSAEASFPPKSPCRSRRLA